MPDQVLGKNEMSVETKSFGQWAVLIEGAMKDARLAIGGLLVVNTIAMISGPVYFAAGALAAVFAAAFAYLANLEYAGAVHLDMPASRRGLMTAKISHAAAASCALMGAVLFIAGMVTRGF
jgi:hypothetical protein